MKHSNDKNIFIHNTLQHIMLVHCYISLCWADYSGYMDLNQYLKHDYDKFDDNVLNEYCKIKDTKKIKENKCVLNHIKNSKHHPEKWDSKFTGNDGYICHAGKMPYKFLIEMVCDWHARAVMSGEKSAKKWADDNIGKRWIFTPDQETFIYDIIRFLRDFDVNKIAEIPNAVIEKRMMKLGCLKYKITEDYKIYEKHIDGESVFFELPVRLKGMERTLVICSLLASLKFISEFDYLLPFIKSLK